MLGHRPGGTGGLLDQSFGGSIEEVAELPVLGWVTSTAYDLINQTQPERLADGVRRALELVGDGRVGIDITAEYELADVEAAIADLAGGATHGKSVVRIG
ncbi:zinc-binding dehydrogenase [Streptosporangium sp. NPDC003464]